MSEGGSPESTGAEETSTALERVVGRLLQGGLPEVLAGPAGKALSRLVGGFADIPAAWLEQKSQAIRDNTAARTELLKSLRQAVSSDIGKNQDVLERAQEAWLGKLYRKQVNREAIALETAILLDEQPQAANAAEPSEDWMNLYESFAENANSEKLRNIWSHVLAGEIRHPKSFSLRTLQFISTLDAETAQIFEEIAPEVSFEAMICFPSRFNFTPKYGQLTLLQEAGLLNNSLANQFSPVSQKYILNLKPFVIAVFAEKEEPIRVPNMSLTRVGVEIYNLLKITATYEVAKEQAKHFAALIGANSAKISKSNADGIIDFDESETIYFLAE